MHVRKFYRTLALAAAVLSLWTGGCAQEHAKFKERASKDWEKARMGFLYEVAEQQYKVGDYDKCREQLKQMLSANVPFEPMYVLSAKLSLATESGSLDDAASSLKKAEELKSDDAEVYYLLGVVYQRWQKFDVAADYYQQAADHKATEPNYVLAIAEMRISLGQLDQAKQLLEEKIGYFEQSAAMRVALAKIATLQENWAEAAKQYREATVLLPEDKQLRWSYAEALFDAGKYSDAARIFENMRNDPPAMPKARRSLSKGPDPKEDPKQDEEAAKSTKCSLLTMLGECYLQMQRPLDARDCFQEVIRAQPENMTAYVSLGKACLLTNDYRYTADAAKKVLRTEPENLDALILQAAVQQKQKKWSDALDTLALAGKVAPKDTTVLCMQGFSELQLGKKDAAERYLQKAVASNPSDLWANELLAQVKGPAPEALAPSDGAPVRRPEVTSAEPVGSIRTDDLSPDAAKPISDVAPATPAGTGGGPAGSGGNGQ